MVAMTISSRAAIKEGAEKEEEEGMTKPLQEEGDTTKQGATITTKARTTIMVCVECACDCVATIMLSRCIQKTPWRTQIFT